MHRFRLILRFLARLAAICGLFAFLLFLAGRVLSDRTHPTQYLSWGPGHFWIIGIALLALLSWLASLAARPSRASAEGYSDAPRPLAARSLRRVLLLALAAIAAWSLFEWNAWRTLFGVAPPAGERIRVIAWNPSWTTLDDFHERVLDLRPDIAIFANNPVRTQWPTLREELGPASDVQRYRRLTILSRYPIVRWGGTSLGVKGARPQTHKWATGGEIFVDDGHAIFAELDTRPILGRNIVVWALDLPSDPYLFKRDVMRQAAHALSTTTDPIYRRNRDRLDEADDRAGLAGFPKPDIIAGDFNNPRGAASLDEFLSLLGHFDGYHHAYDDAGSGPSATWPRRSPILAIDNLFISPDWTAAAYRAIDPGAGEHRIQVGDLVLTSPPGVTPPPLP